MNTLDEKQAEIELFLRNEEKAERLKLEKAIAGKLQITNLVWPGMTTLFLCGFMYFESITPHGKSSITLAISVLMLAFSSWIQALSVINQRQILALKKYFDLKLNEIEVKK